MSRLIKGEIIPDFSFETPFEKDLDLHQVISGCKRTALVFLRYYGCTLCQLDINEYKKSYAQIQNAGGQLLVVLQSDPSGLAEELKSQDALPFRLICDPEKKLYEEFEILPAKSKIGAVGMKTIAKIEKAKKSGLSHGRYEGDEMQLPAAFVTDENGVLLYVNYAKTFDGAPSAEELIEVF